MSRLDYDLPNQCHCSVQNNAQSTPKNVIFTDNNENNDFENRNNCSRQTSSNQNSQTPASEQIDNQTWQNLSSLRDKACKFIKSESECNTSTNSDSSFMHCNCKSERCCRERCLSGNVFLEHAEDFINYSPKSSFLRDMKERCLYPQNSNPIQNFVPTFSETVDVPSYCEKCLTKAYKKLEGHKSQMQSGTQDYTQNNQFCWCKDPLLRSRGIDFILNTCKSAIEEYKNNMLGVKYCGCENCIPMDKDNAREKRNGYRRDKDRRKSKTKKSNKCQDRRKRKSNDAEKSDSQDCFEPSLKRPHENSCERCWRYASPSRSPVNKPDQKYDPNFRKARSCTDFSSRGEQGESNSNLEVETRSPYRRPNTMSSTRAQEVDTEVKELIVQPGTQGPRTPERRIQPTNQGARTADGCVQPTTQGPRTPDRSVQPMTQGPRTPDRSVQPMTQGPRTPDRSVQPMTQGPRTPEKSVQSSAQALKTPDRSVQRVPRIEEGKPCEPPGSGGVLYSGQVRRPRPKSCTPVLPSGEVNCANYAENLNTTEYMGLPVHTRNQSPNIQELSNRSIRNCENLNSATPKEISRNAVRPCEHLNSRQIMNTTYTVSRKPDNMDSDRFPGFGGTSQALNHQISAPSWGSNSTVYNEVATPRTARPPTPSPNRVNDGVRIDQGNTSRLQKSHTPNCVHFKSSSPSQVQQTEQLPTTGTSVANQVNPPQNYNSRPRSVGYDVMPHHDNNNDFQNAPVGFERMPSQNINSAHPFRPCNCCSSSSQARGTGCSLGRGSEKKLFCCHCRQKEGSRNLPTRYDHENYSFNRQKPQNNVENERPFSQPVCDNQGYYPGCSEPNPVVNQCNSSYRPSDGQFMKNFSGKSMQCPYAEHYHSKVPLITVAPPDDTLGSHRGDNYPPVNPPLGCQPNYNPTKYSVYYMTKSKDKGNEVEVLVEELTERCLDEKKNSKTKAVKNKMERLLECHSDSMALRFQKGVSDSFRNSQSSRILYF